MNPELFKKIGKAEQYIESHMIIKSIESLQEAARLLNEWDSFHTLDSIKSTYGYIRHYYLEGVPDPNRNKAVEDIKNNLRKISNSLLRQASIDNEGIYYSEMRMDRLNKYRLEYLLARYRAVLSQISLAEAAGEEPRDLIALRYNLLERIFGAVLVSYNDRDDIRLIKDYLCNEDTDEPLRLQIFYALVLSLFAWLDFEKMKLLISLADGLTLKSPLTYRARLAMTLCIPVWKEELRKIPEIWQQLMFTSEFLGSELQAPVKIISGTVDTERVAAKIQEEVIPEIMRMRPDMLKNLSNQEVDPDDPEYNPAWQELLDKSGIGKKMEEITEMVSKGADVMMITFSQLKRFPFFQKVSNWFLPFDTSNPGLSLDAELRNILNDLISANGNICESDKYSLALALNQIPDSQKNAMISQFKAQMQQMKDLKEGDSIKGEDSPANQEMVTCLRDLYRFFKLSTFTHGFRNPFNSRPEYHYIEPFKAAMSEDGFDYALAEFYFQRKCYRDALSVLNYLAAGKGSTDAAVWQKLGFCNHKLGNLHEARKAYMTAELFGDSGLWLLKRLAHVNAALGNRAEAIEYYNKVLAEDPDNKNVLMNIVALLIEGPEKNIPEALKHIYHLNYMAPEDKNITSILACTLMLNGETDKSKEIYDSLLDEKSPYHLWMNAAHASFLKNDISVALERYRHSYRLDSKNFDIDIRKDIPVLKDLGADEEGLMMVIEAARE